MALHAHGNSSTPRLLVLGCGYVGSAVAAAALARGWKVTALTRNATTATLLRASGMNTIVADLASDAWHDQVEPQTEHVLNCVSSGRTGIAGYQRSYLHGMESIIRWAQSRGPVGTIVYTSSTSVYPQTDGPVDEGAPVVPRDERTALLIESEARLRAIGSACARWFILRLAGIYGPGRHHLLEQVRAGVVGGDTDRRLNLIHRHDIVSAIEACFAAPPGIGNQVCNVADDTPTPKREVVTWLANRLSIPLPAFAKTAELRETPPPDRSIANGKLKSALGWQPRYPSYREGYEAILQSDSA